LGSARVHRAYHGSSHLVLSGGRPDWARLASARTRRPPVWVGAGSRRHAARAALAAHGSGRSTRSTVLIVAGPPYVQRGGPTINTINTINASPKEEKSIFLLLIVLIVLIVGDGAGYLHCARTQPARGTPRSVDRVDRVDRAGLSAEDTARQGATAKRPDPGSASAATTRDAQLNLLR